MYNLHVGFGETKEQNCL